VRDAETLDRTAAVEERDWIRAGRFRFWQRAESLEIRVALSSADVRVAFEPRAHGTGADDVASLVGVLLAGGDNGKTEMMDGYTWASVWCRDVFELERLSDRVAGDIAAWTGAAIDRAGTEWPAHRDGTWATRLRIGERRHLFTVYVPMYRDGVLPWAAIT
jgi:hypothetical protein